MMMNFKKLIIIYPPIISLYFLCMPKLSSSAECCKTSYCNYDDYRTPIKFPFRLRDDQNLSCGCPGFDLHCENELGLLLQLPDIGKVIVDHISYSPKELQLSDPDQCLANKLLNLHLNTTPFREISSSMNYQLYNCSGLHHPSDSYNKIDCLSGSDYSVVYNTSSVSTITNYSNCSFLQQMSVPMISEDSYYDLSDIPIIHLTWEEEDCTTCVPGNANNDCNNCRIAAAVLLGTIVPITLIIVSIIYCCRRSRPRPPRSQAAMLASLHATINRNTNRSTPASPGLDQITIDSYPILILGEHDSLTTKLRKEPCSICLSEYSPKEAVKMLPNCLHHFHADCIDIWLKSKATCPICRISPAQQPTNVNV